MTATETYDVFTDARALRYSLTQREWVAVADALADGLDAPATEADRDLPRRDAEMIRGAVILYGLPDSAASCLTADEGARHHLERRRLNARLRASGAVYDVVGPVAGHDRIVAAARAGVEAAQAVVRAEATARKAEGIPELPALAYSDRLPHGIAARTALLVRHQLLAWEARACREGLGWSQGQMAERMGYSSYRAVMTQESGAHGEMSARVQSAWRAVIRAEIAERRGAPLTAAESTATLLPVELGWLCVALGLTQTQLGGELGLAQSAVSDLTTGRRPMSPALQAHILTTLRALRLIAQ